jgi:hypothetical protein
MAGQKLRKMNFDRIIQKGENDQGFTSQTANGTSHATGTGWNCQWDWQREQVNPDPVRPAGRSNRTGE